MLNAVFDDHFCACTVCYGGTVFGVRGLWMVPKPSVHVPFAMTDAAHKVTMLYSFTAKLHGY